MPLFTHAGGLLRVGVALAASSACCCNCCCASITLNDLLYGDHEYSWPVIKPAVLQSPAFGVIGDPPECVPEGDGWVVDPENSACLEKTNEFYFGPMTPAPVDAQAAQDYCTAMYSGDGVTTNEAVQDPVTGQWACHVIETSRACCDWQLRPACLRWVCRCVDEGGNVVCEYTHGGPTINALDLPALVTAAMGPEPAAGCYVYTVEFFGWRARSGGWIGRDDVYTVYRTLITSCP